MKTETIELSLDSFIAARAAIKGKANVERDLADAIRLFLDGKAVSPAVAPAVEPAVESADVKAGSKVMMNAMDSIFS